MNLLLGDNIESLKALEANSVDSVVTDPPYALNFMNKKWDASVPSVDFWREVYRVLKPGGHVLSFGGTRTYHRMTVNIEDAGFEIRDQIMWLYGSGFPKSHNIGKSVDKIRGNDREVVGERRADDITSGNMHANNKGQSTIIDITKGTSEWEGWGTALKPANEPICVARKPLSEKTIVENVLRWGTGGINIDGCRVEGAYGTGQNEIMERDADIFNDGENKMTGHKKKIMVSNKEGRFPANLILDEEAGQVLDEQSGPTSQGHWPKGKTKGFGDFGGGEATYEGVGPKDKNKDKHGASRFFYQAKVGKKERNIGLDAFEDKTIHDDNNKYGIDKFNTKPKKNNHPTVKPINLMAYLCRLITPPNGIVLDPFMGSGSTGIAAKLEGFDFIGMELDEDYFKIASARVESYEKYRDLLKK
jgi:DNA modification methylase